MNDNTLSFVMASNCRQDVLLALHQRRMTVSQLSNFLHKSPSTLYRVVKGLVDKNLLEHNNATRYRIYRITDEGVELLKEMDVIK